MVEALSDQDQAGQVQVPWAMSTPHLGLLCVPPVVPLQAPWDGLAPAPDWARAWPGVSVQRPKAGFGHWASCCAPGSRDMTASKEIGCTVSRGSLQQRDLYVIGLQNNFILNYHKADKRINCKIKLLFCDCLE